MYGLCYLSILNCGIGNICSFSVIDFGCGMQCLVIGVLFS